MSKANGTALHDVGAGSGGPATSAATRLQFELEAEWLLHGRRRVLLTSG